MLTPTWVPSFNFLLGQLELARGFLHLAEVSDDPAVASRNLFLADRALTFVQQRMKDDTSQNSLRTAWEELSARTQALRS
jgi:hypothetical protein